MIEINISYDKNDLKLETLNGMLSDVEKWLKEEENLECLSSRQADHKAYFDLYPKNCKLLEVHNSKKCVIFVDCRVQKED